MCDIMASLSYHEVCALLTDLQLDRSRMTHEGLSPEIKSINCRFRQQVNRINFAQFYGKKRLSLQNVSIVCPELLISISGSPGFYKGFSRRLEGVSCPLMMILQNKCSSEWIKDCNFHAISAQFSFLLMFSFFEMAMIAIQFCPHSTASLNEPFITNFLSF